MYYRSSLESVGRLKKKLKEAKTEQQRQKIRDDAGELSSTVLVNMEFHAKALRDLERGDKCAGSYDYHDSELHYFSIVLHELRGIIM